MPSQEGERRRGQPSDAARMRFRLSSRAMHDLGTLARLMRADRRFAAGVLLFAAVIGALMGAGRMDLLDGGGRFVTELRWVGLVLACLGTSYLVSFLWGALVRAATGARLAPPAAAAGAAPVVVRRRRWLGR